MKQLKKEIVNSQNSISSNRFSRKPVEKSRPIQITKVLSKRFDFKTSTKMKKQTVGIVIFAFTVTILACKKDYKCESITNPVVSSIEKNSKIVPQNYEGEVVLGDQLQNPYTVENMKAAAIAIQQEGYSILLPTDITKTHLYVKFMPIDSNQYEELNADTNLSLYDYPLDYEIIQSGNYYHNPNLPSSTPTYQYACVKNNFSFPQGIQYEILAELYIPEEDSRINDEIIEHETYLDKLLDKAYVLTGNFNDTLNAPITMSKTTAAKFNPGGKIEIFDTRLGTNIGLEGVEMRARRWFTTLKAQTSFNGNFRMSKKFKRSCNYSLHFTQGHFSIREHLFGSTAWIDGPKIKGDWNLVISSGYNRFVGHIFRGAFRYHYGFIDGLQRPYRPSSKRTLLLAKDGSRSWAGINYGIFPLLKIARYNGSGGVEFHSDEIFSTTCHELAHTSHIIVMNSGVIQYSQVSNQIQESWPVAIE